MTSDELDGIAPEELPPEPPPIYTPERGAFPNMGLMAFCRLLLEHWRENPICRRLWHHIRPYALALALFSTIYYAATAWVQLSNSAAGGAFVGGTFTTSALVAMGLLYLLMLINFCVLIGLPIVYGRWAWKHSFGGDEMMRAAPLSATDRLFGILTPGFLGLAVFYAPSLIVAPFIMMLAQIQMNSILGAEDPSVVLLVTGAASSIAQRIGMAVIYAFVCSAVLVRVLTLDRITGAKLGRSWGKVVIVYLVFAMFFVMLGCLVMVPGGVIMLILANSTGGNQTMSSFAISFWLFSQIMPALVNSLGAYGSFVLARLFWRNDFPTISHETFAAKELEQ